MDKTKINGTVKRDSASAKCQCGNASKWGTVIMGGNGMTMECGKCGATVRV